MHSASQEKEFGRSAELRGCPERIVDQLKPNTAVVLQVAANLHSYGNESTALS